MQRSRYVPSPRTRTHPQPAQQRFLKRNQSHCEHHLGNHFSHLGTSCCMGNLEGILMPRNFGAFRDWDRPQPLEDSFQPITKKQLDYIELLRHDIGMSLAVRNRPIMDICKLPSPAAGQVFDIYTLSRAQASKVIEQFKEWKESPNRF